MMYIYHLHSKYYLMMEDDVISSRNYMKTILEVTVQRLDLTFHRNYYATFEKS